jgi:hypothetical protein
VLLGNNRQTAQEGQEWKTKAHDLMHVPGLPFVLALLALSALWIERSQIAHVGQVGQVDPASQVDPVSPVVQEDHVGQVGHVGPFQRRVAYHRNIACRLNLFQQLSYSRLVQ